MLCSKVSFSDGNEIKNSTKGKRIKRATKGRESYFYSPLMILQRLYTYSMLIYGYCNVILLLLSFKILSAGNRSGIFLAGHSLVSVSSWPS